jgi:cytochrome c-type biogenesis protein
VVNPCGFPLLPAFLSFYLGADEQRLPRASTRILQGLLVGALVTIGFVGLFALVSLPVSFGVALVASAVPWVGLLTGAVLAFAGLIVISGRRVAMPVHLQLPVRRERKLGAMLLFGVGYGAASLGCTLPLFLTLVGASAGGSKITVFLAYAVGTAVVLMAVSVVVALAREGVVRGLRSLLPHMHWIAGLLLLVSGGYLFYYWARLQWGDSATVADDPIVSFGVRFSGDVERFAHGRGPALVAAAGAIVALALLSALVRRRRQTTPPSLVRE